MKINHRLIKKYNIIVNDSMTVIEASVKHGIMPNAIRNVIYADKVRAFKDNKWNININDINNYSQGFSNRILLVPNKRYNQMLRFVLDLLRKNYVVGHNCDDIKCKLKNMKFDACILCSSDDIDLIRSISDIKIIFVGEYLNTTAYNVVSEREVSVGKIESILKFV